MLVLPVHQHIILVILGRRLRLLKVIAFLLAGELLGR